MFNGRFFFFYSPCWETLVVEELQTPYGQTQPTQSYIVPPVEGGLDE